MARRRRHDWEIHWIEITDGRAGCSCGWTFEGETPGVAVKQHGDMNGGATVHNATTGKGQRRGQ